MHICYKPYHLLHTNYYILQFRTKKFSCSKSEAHTIGFPASPLIQLQSHFPHSVQQRTAAWRRLLPIPSFVRSGILMEIVWCKRKSSFPFPAAFFFHSSRILSQYNYFFLLWSDNLFLGGQNWQFYTICWTQQRHLHRQVQPDSAYTLGWLHMKQWRSGSSLAALASMLPC